MATPVAVEEAFVRVWEAIEGHIDSSVDVLGGLVHAFQERPGTEVELAITQHTLLLKLVLDAQEVSQPQTFYPLPPAFSYLSHLSLVALPAALAAAVSIGQASATGCYTPSMPQQYMCNAVRLAVTLFVRFLREESVPDALDVAGQVAGCYWAVSSGVLKTILTVGNPADTLKYLMAASSVLLLLARKQGAEAKAQVASDNWQSLTTLLEVPNAKDIFWKDFLERFGKVVYAAATASFSDYPASNEGSIDECIDLICGWKACSGLHAALLFVFKGVDAKEPLVAQWAESAGLAGAGQCLEIADAVAQWGDGLGPVRVVVLNNCCAAALSFLSGGDWLEEDVLQPAFSTFAAMGRHHPPSSRIPGRQAVAAMLSAVALLEKFLRLAARYPLQYWCDTLDEADIGQPESDETPEQPWALGYTLATAAARWLGQRLPARPGGQEPAPLISLAEEGAVLGTFKSLLGLLATQRKVLLKWAAEVASVLCVQGVYQSQHPVLYFLRGMEAVTEEAAHGALALVPRLAGQQLEGFTAERSIESVAAVALTTTLVLHQSLVSYERWAWQHLPMSGHLLFRVQLAGTMLHALAQRQDAQPHAAVAAAGILLSEARGMDLRDVMASPARGMWVGFISTLSEAGAGQQEPSLLLLAALLGGLVRVLVGWAQKGCEEELGANGVEVLAMLGNVLESICKVWLNMLEVARLEKLLPAMEAAAALAIQHDVTWSDSSDAGHTEQRSSSSSSSSKAGVVVVGRTPKSEEQQQGRQQQQQEAASAVLEGPAAPPSSCPLGQLQTELAMQQCGQPSQKVVDELAPGIQFDKEWLPRFPDGGAGGAAPGGSGCEAGNLPAELADCSIM
ncbi:hypothetical protein N2152v2_000901 [Parachlorella kessleri]